MRYLALFALTTFAAVSVAALDLGNQPPAKSVSTSSSPTPVAPRQGGETIETAFPIPSLPFADTGTTAGYLDDYDEVCPMGGNIAPDVVYRFESTMPQSIEVDLCGSDYDTKVYIYDDAYYLIACSDDYYFGEPCGVYVSRIEEAALGVGAYFIVVDGYGNDYGDYVIAVENHVDCLLTCPYGGIPEGEPPLVPNYVDNWNGGCNTPPAHPFQTIVADASGERILCGAGGWYVVNGSPFRDTDWYEFQMGPSGTAEITADAQYATYIFELGPQDCGSVSVIQSASVGPCAEATMTISGYAAGETVWFWVGSTVFEDPDGGDNEYDYVVWFSGLEPSVATELATWSSLKALYR